MSIIKLEADDNSCKTINLNNFQQIIDMKRYKNIDFFAFNKENTKFTFKDDTLILSLNEQVVAYFSNLSFRLKNDIQMKCSFISFEGKEETFVIQNKYVLKYYLSKFFTYVEKIIH